MNHVARRIGRSLALVLPVVLVLSGTLAVTRVPWATSSPSDAQVLTVADQASSRQGTDTPRTPQELLRDRLIAQLEQHDPGVALTALQKEMNRRPSLARHCTSLAKALGRAAVRKYGAAHRAQAYARPVCDTAFAAGVAER